MSAGCSAVQLSVSAQAMVDGIMRRDAVSSCQSAATYEIVKRCWSRNWLV